MTCPSCGAANEATAEVCFSCRTVLSAVSKGTVLASRYEIRDLVGRGGMGTVYRARDLVLDEEVAVKVLRADVAQAPGMAERFLSEIKLARRVSHPNVCRIHEYGEDGALRFISMELVSGRSVKEVLAAGPLPVTQAFAVAEQAARGLVAIHEVGIVHRDLKPANLTLDETGRVRVMDFGIAKAAGRTGNTTAGYLLGSPEYMSPEQAQGRGADFRSDLYSLGIVVFELFTGRLPFRAETPVGTLLLQIEAKPPLEAHADAIPAALAPVLRRALAKDPAKRHGSAHELAEELRSAAAGTVSGPRPWEAGSAKSWPTPGRAWRLGAAAAAFVLAVAAIAWISTTSSSPFPDRSSRPSLAPAPTAGVPSPSASPKSRSSPGMEPAGTPEPRPEVPREMRRPAPAARLSPSPPASASSTAPPEGSASSTAPDPSTPVPLEAESVAERSRPAPEPPSAPAPGFLLVVVSPWADVTIDGQAVGLTPLGRISLPPGPHTVRLVHPAFQPYPRKVMVRSGEITRLTVDLAQDGVRVVR